jgi:protein-tyrosine phosphatase
MRYEYLLTRLHLFFIPHPSSLIFFSMYLLFLCTGNFYRSRYAEELFNHLAEQAGLAWRATSRGVYPIIPHPETQGPMSPYTVAALEGRGVKIHGRDRLPQRATLDDLQEAGLVIALQEKEHRPLIETHYPSFTGTILYWHIGDVVDTPAEVALGEIDTAVDKLVASMSNEQ